MKFPNALSTGTLLAFQKGTKLADCVMAELVSQGHQDWGFEAALRLRASHKWEIRTTCHFSRNWASMKT